MSFLSNLFKNPTKPKFPTFGPLTTLSSLFNNQTRQLPNDSGSYQSPVLNQGNVQYGPEYTPPQTPPTPPTPSRPPASGGSGAVSRPATQSSPQSQSGLSAEDLAYMANLVRNTQLAGQGDIGNYAQNVYSNENPDSMTARADMGRLENTQMDLATGETDPYEWASESGIPYSPQELNAIEKAMAGIYDPALETAKARYERALRMEESEREHAQNMELQSFKAGGGSGGVSGSYTPGSDPSVDAWVNLIKNDKAKITTVPAALKNKVAQALSSLGADQDNLSDEGVLALNAINSLMNNPKLNRIFGPIDQWLGGHTNDDAIEAANKFKQLAGILALGMRGLLKGSGSISDYESKVLANAATSLKRNLSGGKAKKELIQIKGALITQSGRPAMVRKTKGGVSVVEKMYSGDIKNALLDGYSVEYVEDNEGFNSQSMDNTQSQSSGDPDYDLYLQSIGAI